VLRGIFRRKGNEVMRDWKKLHNEKLFDFYSSPSAIRMIKLRRMRWVGHVAGMRGRGTHVGHWWEYHKERDR
jgi:hypothetical protein